MSVIVLDLETFASDHAAEFVEKPNLDAILPAGNLKDPEKIAASIAERKAAALDGYKASLGRAALDWNLSRIVAIGYHLSGEPEPRCEVARTEAEEASMLRWFWSLKGTAHIVGFNARNFDVPTLIQRSRLLGVPHPRVSLARFGRGDVLDVYDELTFEGARGAGIMPQSLKAFARRFGLPVSDPTNGKDIAQLVASEDWEGVRSHCLSDVDLTRELAVRIGLVKPWARVA